MKTGFSLMIVGGSMFIIGLILFYTISAETNNILEFTKNMGTFVGLSGIGVTLAGLVLYFISKNEPPIKENYDV
tara:strand:+ start:117 stop:338 length:222 start_codon:yes stop_codon:yes gene_type:complete